MDRTDKQVVGDRPGAASAAAKPYVDILLREMRATAAFLKARDTFSEACINSSPDFSGGWDGVSTLFFGGGTPSLCPPELVGSLLDTVRECFGIADGAEISVEMDPGTFDEVRRETYSTHILYRTIVGRRWVFSISKMRKGFWGRAPSRARDLLLLLLVCWRAPGEDTENLVILRCTHHPDAPRPPVIWLRFACGTSSYRRGIPHEGPSLVHQALLLASYTIIPVHMYVALWIGTILDAGAAGRLSRPGSDAREHGRAVFRCWSPRGLRQSALAGRRLRGCRASQAVGIAELQHRCYEVYNG